MPFYDVRPGRVFYLAADWRLQLGEFCSATPSLHNNGFTVHLLHYNGFIVRLLHYNGFIVHSLHFKWGYCSLATDSRTQLEESSFLFGSTSEIVQSVTLLQDLSLKAEQWDKDLTTYRACEKTLQRCARARARVCVMSCGAGNWACSC